MCACIERSTTPRFDFGLPTLELQNKSDQPKAGYVSSDSEQNRQKARTYCYKIQCSGKFV